MAISKWSWTILDGTGNLYDTGSNNILPENQRLISVRSCAACFISPRSEATWLMFEPGLYKPHGFLLGTYGNVVS